MATVDIFSPSVRKTEQPRERFPRSPRHGLTGSLAQERDEYNARVAREQQAIIDELLESATVGASYSPSTEAPPNFTVNVGDWEPNTSTRQHGAREWVSVDELVSMQARANVLPAIMTEEEEREFEEDMANMWASDSYAESDMDEQDGGGTPRW